MVQTIAIASGKGGVGKTSLAVNCALNFSLSDHKVILLDADFGLANAHILLDCKPQANIGDFIDGTKSMADVIQSLPSSLKLIPGGSGVLEIMNLDTEKRWSVIRGLDYLEAELDYLFVDTPAGASNSSIDFAAACDKIVIVLVGEPTSFMDAYAFVKALSMEKGIVELSVVVNMAKSEIDAKKSFDSFRKIVGQFLQVELSFLGWLPQSQTIANSILSRKPFARNQKTQSNLNEKLSEICSNLQNFEVRPINNIKFFGN